MKRFDSTVELYGVNPKVLAEMKYKDALQVMYKGLWKRKRKIADLLFEEKEHDVAVKLQDDLRKVTKAIALTDLKIEEIKDV